MRGDRRSRSESKQTKHSMFVSGQSSAQAQRINAGIKDTEPCITLHHRSASTFDSLTLVSLFPPLNKMA